MIVNTLTQICLPAGGLQNRKNYRKGAKAQRGDLYFASPRPRLPKYLYGGQVCGETKCSELLMKTLFFFLLITFFSFTSFSNTFTVINTNDAGTGSLRQAMQNAAIYPGSHTINFNIPTTDAGYNSSIGVWTIALTSTLPIITHSGILLDGTSQTVYAGNPNQYGPEIMLDGNNQAWADFGFHVYNASNVTIKGFIIGRFVTGVQLSGANAQTNTIAGNYLGCNYNATDTLGNTYGVYILSGPHNNVVGGNTYTQRNIVSGNNHVGIRVVSANSNIIQGNFVGLNRTGNAALRNYDGISIEGLSKFNLIGGYTPAERNYVSGNVAYGMLAFGAGCNYNVYVGNYVGTDTTGTFGVQNTYGLLFDDGASYNTLGGRTPGAGNLLSGNSGYGVFLYNFGTLKDTVVGNLIGTDYTGTVAVPNANGIVVDGPSFLHTIENNVISGNLQMGIDIHIAGSDSNFVISNKIGTDITGLLPLGNQLDGIRIGEGPKNNIIGQPGKGNIIAFNGGNGITVMTPSEVFNTFSENSIYGNAGMGIDLFPAGPTANDAGDADTGPNELMNYPDILSAVNIPSTNNWILSGTLDHSSPAGCRVELFKAEINGAGNAQGKDFLGSCFVNSSGNWTDTVFLLTAYDKIVATATDLSGNTSEFSEMTPLSVKTIAENNFQVDVYPNPAKNNFYVEFYLAKLSSVNIEIIDITGKTRASLLANNLTEGKYQHNFDTELLGLKTGIYLVKFTIDSKVYLRKMNVQ